MQVELVLISAGTEDTYGYFRADEQGAEGIYAFMKEFWSNRATQTEEEWKEHVIAYRKTKGEGFRPVCEKLIERFHGAGGVEAFSLLDLGGASASILYELQKDVPVRKIIYRNVEPFAPFVDDCNRIFGAGSAIVGDAEGFADMPDADFPDAPYSVFFSSLVFCMIHPGVARRSLERASRLSDHIVLYDCIANIDGQLDASHAVVFDYSGNASQFYFAHQFRDYFEQLGFEVVAADPVQIAHAKMKTGWGVIHARRR